MTIYAIPADMTQDLFNIPERDTDNMYATIQPVAISRLTTGSITGTGAFDTIMASLKAQLQGEYAANRITGGEYTKAYLELTQMALQTSLQFVLGQDQAFWQAQNQQIAAVTGRIALEAARYNYSQILPQQSALLAEQVTGAGLQNTGMTTANAIASYNLADMLPAQLSLLTTQTAGEVLKNTGLGTANSMAVYNLNNMLPQQLLLLTGQTLLVHEQAEVQHAQTSDVRLDNFAVSIQGLILSQKDLYAQQVTSYQRDAEVKAAKIFSDSWITQKTIDDGLLPPLGFTNDSVNSVLTVIMSNNGFGAPSA